MKTSVQIQFESDVDYEEWRKKHAEEFILNTSHTFDQASSVVHKCSCGVLDRAARDTSPGRLTGGTYYKVGAPTVRAAREWLRSKRKTTIARLCGVCFKLEVEDSGRDGNFGFVEGALYNRRDDLHGKFGGQTQGGMSTPKNAPVILLFTGDSGLEHGYRDDWDSDGLFHYVGEGQTGDMTWSGANHAVRDQPSTGKAILLFRALGKSKPYRFMGRFASVGFYTRDAIPDRDGHPRQVIVFRLKQVELSPAQSAESKSDTVAPLLTTAVREIEVRTKQSLFRKRLALVEKGCRVTGICDLRFLTASHIKPWSDCASSHERIDGNNGLLLAPHIDHLFDRGWITFTDRGDLLCCDELPEDIRQRLGLLLERSRTTEPFNEWQRAYLQFHREHKFQCAEKNSRAYQIGRKDVRASGAD